MPDRVLDSVGTKRHERPFDFDSLLLQALGRIGPVAGPECLRAAADRDPFLRRAAMQALGVIGRKLDWTMIGIGAAIGAVIVAVDAFLDARKWFRFPPLAVGMGIYLPMSATLPVMLGALIGWWFNRRAARTTEPGRTQHLGVLVASGMIVGESLFGVLLAGLIVALGTDAPLALIAPDFSGAEPIGFVVFAALILLLYGWMLRRGAAAS